MVHQRVYDSEGEAEDTHKDVREWQVANENAGDIDFFSATGNDADEANVPQQPQQHCYAVPHYKESREDRRHMALIIVPQNSEVWQELGLIPQPLLHRLIAGSPLFQR